MLKKSLGALPRKVKFVRFVQPANPSFPMLVTLAGIVRLVRLVQPANAEFPMLVTLLGSV
jgi:hypothetical protein